MLGMVHCILDGGEEPLLPTPAVEPRPLQDVPVLLCEGESGSVCVYGCGCVRIRTFGSTNATDSTRPLLSLVPKPSLAQPWKNVCFSVVAKKAVRGGLGTRLVTPHVA